MKNRLAACLVLSMVGITPGPADRPAEAAVRVAQTSCPPAGARYRRDNISSSFVVVSLGGPYHSALGCQWRREDTREEIWLGFSMMTPLGGASSPSPGRPPAPRGAGGGTGSQTPGAFGPIANGVYECDAPINVGGMTMGSPQTGLFFGVTGPGAYRDFNGGRGAFTVSGDTLTMTSGPLRGTRYRREGATLFKPLNAQGQTGSIRCVLNRSKSLTGRW